MGKEKYGHMNPFPEVRETLVLIVVELPNKFALIRN